MTSPSRTQEYFRKPAAGGFTATTAGKEFTAKAVLIASVPAVENFQKADKFENKGVTYCASQTGLWNGCRSHRRW